MSKDKGLRPGQTAPKSGQYEQVGPKGGKIGKEIFGEPDAFAERFCHD